MSRVGIDLVRVSEIERSLACFGERYLSRIFTEQERRDAAQGGWESARRLAARFAAKEATIKVLRPPARWLDWRLIEVRRHESGWSDLKLHGEARALAKRQGLDQFSVSLSHEGDYAAAAVMSLSVGAPVRMPSRKRAAARRIHLTTRKVEHSMNTEEQIRAVLKEQGRLSRDAASLAPGDNLYQAGLTSHASVNVMLALEGAFDVEFPDRMLKRGVFESIATIKAAIDELKA